MSESDIERLGRVLYGRTPQQSVADPVIKASEVDAAIEAFSARIPKTGNVPDHVMYMAMLDALTAALKIRRAT